MRHVMAANSGLITRWQARDCGLTSTQITQLVRVGSIVVVRRGVFADAELWHSLDEDRGQPRLRTRAAIATMHRGFVVSHDSSAHEHELELLTPPQPFVHITRPGSTAAWTRAGVKHHLAGFNRHQVILVNGLEVMDLARTAVDIARELGRPYGEIACDAAMRAGATRAELEAAVARMAYWPGVRRVHPAIAFADPRAANLAETLGRLFVEELGLHIDDLQFPVQVGDAIRWGDIRVGRHLFEVDGHHKLRAPEDGGFASAPPHEVVWAEKKRDRDLAREGLGTSHLVWQDFWMPHRTAALRRARDEYDETVARLGVALSERLLRQAREIRGRRGA
jgi:hypothetical protein